MNLTLLIFVVAYAAIAVGKVPGLRVDRTGAALLGAIALIVTEQLTPQAAWASVNFSTVALLFGLMVVSASFVVAGFYDWATLRIASLAVGPTTLLAILIGISALLSALLTNDVVVLAMTPLLVQITLARGLNPVPFLLGLCFAANAGSAGTLIGSPQNIIIGDGLGVSFTRFLQAAGLPSLLSVPVVWGILVLIYRGDWILTAKDRPRPVAPRPAAQLDRWETAKAAIVTAAVIVAFVATPVPHALIALAAAGVLLLNRRIASSDILKYIDGDLLLLLFCLFVMNHALAQTGVPSELLADLRATGLDLQQPVPLLLVMSVLSNVVGNNPAAMLMLPYVDRARPDLVVAAMALGTGFASNLYVSASLAGIIVSEAARRYGVTISFAEFVRAGAPVSLACLAIAVAWVLYLAAPA
jgi:Na+/H+ antiporter NhaD/arsenite permease-like protein